MPHDLSPNSAVLTTPENIFYKKILIQDRFLGNIELMRNMVGVLANLAETPSLRKNLLTTEIMEEFGFLLRSNDAGNKTNFKINKHKFQKNKKSIVERGIFQKNSYFLFYIYSHLLLENRDISTTKHPVNLRPVCKLEFVHCGPVEKKQNALSVLV